MLLQSTNLLPYQEFLGPIRHGLTFPARFVFSFFEQKVPRARICPLLCERRSAYKHINVRDHLRHGRRWEGFYVGSIVLCILQ